MHSIKLTMGDLAIAQIDSFGPAQERGARVRVTRGDGSVIGEFTLVQGDDGWLPMPVPGSAHPGLLHSTAIDFARAVNEGRVHLD